MKIKHCIFATLAVLAATGLASCGSGSSNDPFANVDYLPVRISDGGNWSLYAPDGTIKFNDEFKERPTVVYNGYFTVKEGEGYSFYKVSGDKFELVKDAEGLKSVGYMEEGLVPMTFPKDRIAVYNGDGEKKFTLEPVKGKEITQCAAGFSEGMLVIEDEEGNMGYVNTKGEVVIAPKYYNAGKFNEGYAVVALKGDDEMKYQVIDKKGETVFTLRNGMQPAAYYFMHDKFVAKDANDRVVFLDTKGEVIFKCPSKVKAVSDYNDKYIVYRSEDNEWGIMDFEGNTVIRPKYSAITIMGPDKFLASTEEYAEVCNAEGEESLRIDDFKRVAYLGKFGFLGIDKRTYAFLDAEGKPVKNAEFADIADNNASHVYSDYFNTAAVVEAIVSQINDKGVGKYEFGTGPGKYFSDPKDYTYQREVSVEELASKGYRYSISASLGYSVAMADYDITYNGYYGYGYSYNYYWNPTAELDYVEFTISAETDWGNSGSVAIADKLKSEGYKLENSTAADNAEYISLLTKGNIAVVISSDKGYHSGRVIVCRNTSSIVESMKSIIAQKNNQPVVVEAEPVEVVDSAVVEEVATVEPDYYY